MLKFFNYLCKIILVSWITHKNLSHVCCEPLAGLADNELSCTKQVASWTVELCVQNTLTNLLTLVVANTYFVFFIFVVCTNHKNC